MTYMLKKILKFSMITGSLAIIVGGSYYYYQHEKFYPSTDDAYVQANVVTLAAQVSGEVSKIFVENQQHVKKGQALFAINPTAFTAELDKAQANLKNIRQQIKVLRASVTSAQALVTERQAELDNAIKQSRRIITLVNKKLYPKAQGDTALRDLKVAKASLHAAKSQLLEAQQKLGAPGDANAQIRAAKAAVTQAKIKLSYTQVNAPVDGRITQFTLRQGSEVTAYQALFSIVDDRQWWVCANFKETDLQRIHPGQKVDIKIDMYPHHTFKGHVVSIAPGSGASFALLPPENATGNWVKVTQRFPVRIALPKANIQTPFRIGSSCTTTVNTHTLP